MSALKILVAGRSGQVAQSLLEAAEQWPDFELTALGRPELDIADRASVDKAMTAVAPDLVINAAAYTAVDKAEDEREAAFAGNETGARNLAEAAALAGIPLLHISTDYVFNGQGTEPYQETDPTAPLGVYGESKLAGERAVADANPKHLILRTAWVYGVYGGNFLKTMLRVAGGRDALNVVADQRGAPTSSHEIAETLLKAAAAIQSGNESWGTYHMAARGEAVWAEFAEAIFAASASHGGPTAQVNHIPSSEYPTPAARPAYSVLNSSKLKDAFGVELSNWREPVDAIVARVLSQKG